MIDHNHTRDDTQIMWGGCLHARRALAEIYGMEPMYNTHSFLSPNVQVTLDLLYREKIRKDSFTVMIIMNWKWEDYMIISYEHKEEHEK